MENWRAFSLISSQSIQSKDIERKIKLIWEKYEPFYKKISRTEPKNVYLEMIRALRGNGKSFDNSGLPSSNKTKYTKFKPERNSIKKLLLKTDTKFSNPFLTQKDPLTWENNFTMQNSNCSTFRATLNQDKAFSFRVNFKDIATEKKKSLSRPMILNHTLKEGSNIDTKSSSHPGLSRIVVKRPTNSKYSNYKVHQAFLKPSICPKFHHQATPMCVLGLHNLSPVNELETSRENREKRTFFSSVKECNVNQVQDWLNLHPEFAFITDSIGQSGMHWAAKRDCPKMIRLLLSHKASIDATDIAGKTPLMIAAKLGKLQALFQLMLSKANPSLKNSSGLTISDMASKQNKTMVGKYQKLWIKGAEDWSYRVQKLFSY